MNDDVVSSHDHLLSHVMVVSIAVDVMLLHWLWPMLIVMMTIVAIPSISHNDCVGNSTMFDYLESDYALVTVHVSYPLLFVRNSDSDWLRENGDGVMNMVAMVDYDASDVVID